MKVEMSNELGYTELIIEESQFYNDDYQMVMLKECELEGILPVVAYGEDDISRYIYDVTGMQSLFVLYEHSPMLDIHVKELARQLLQVMKGVKQHMLDVNKLLLDPKYIFRKGENYYFCYYPLYQKEITYSFHLLTEYFVKVIDYDEIDTVRLVGNLHKNTMDDSYELSEVLDRCSDVETTVGKGTAYKENEIRAIPNTKEGDIWAQEIQDVKEGAEVHTEKLHEKSFKYIFPAENQLGGMLRESPISKWWGKKNSPSSPEQGKIKVNKVKKDKWGDWDDLLNESL